MANDDCSGSTQHADSKSPFSFFYTILGPGQLRGLEVSLGRVLGGASIFFGGGGVQPEDCIDPPPPKLKARPPHFAKEMQDTAGQTLWLWPSHSCHNHCRWLLERRCIQGIEHRRRTRTLWASSARLRPNTAHDTRVLHRGRSAHCGCCASFSYGNVPEGPPCNCQHVFSCIVPSSDMPVVALGCHAGTGKARVQAERPLSECMSWTLCPGGPTAHVVQPAVRIGKWWSRP